MDSPESGSTRLSRGSLAVLDVRSDEAFAAGHLPGSGHVLPGELAERRAELPPRDAPVLVVAEDAERAAAAAAAVESLGYARVFHAHAGAPDIADDLTDRGPAARLWRPAPFLEEVLPGILEALSADGAGPGRVAERPAPRALDLACGAGRDAVYLALHGFDVEGRDHDAEALARARALAARSGVRLATRVFDLERAEPAEPEARFDLVTCFRFLHRPLFPWIERALAPGGWLAYETFRVGQERHGRPRRAHFLLARGELASAFPGLVTVSYEEREPESGPVTARLLARKPGSGEGPANVFRSSAPST